MSTTTTGAVTEEEHPHVPTPEPRETSFPPEIEARRRELVVAWRARGASSPP